MLSKTHHAEERGLEGKVQSPEASPTSLPAWPLCFCSVLHYQFLLDKKLKLVTYLKHCLYCMASLLPATERPGAAAETTCPRPCRLLRNLACLPAPPCGLEYKMTVPAGPRLEGFQEPPKGELSPLRSRVSVLFPERFLEHRHMGEPLVTKKKKKSQKSPVRVRSWEVRLLLF